MDTKIVIGHNELRQVWAGRRVRVQLGMRRHGPCSSLLCVRLKSETSASKRGIRPVIVTNADQAQVFVAGHGVWVVLWYVWRSGAAQGAADLQVPCSRPRYVKLPRIDDQRNGISMADFGPINGCSLMIW